MNIKNHVLLNYNNFGDNHCVIPQEVVEIGRKAFYKSGSLKSVDIPSNVKVIGEYAFYGCNDLTKINLSEGLDTIEKKSFYACKSLGEEIIIPKTVRYIKDIAFGECTSLKIVTILNKDLIFGENVFYCCDNVIIRGIKGSTAEKYAMNEKISFKEIENIYPIESDIISVSDNICSINKYNLNSCAESIIIPNNIIAINDNTFLNCSILKNLVVLNFNLELSENHKIRNIKNIYGFKGSNAEKYANRKNINFIELNQDNARYLKFQNDFVFYKDILIRYIGKNTTLEIPKYIENIGNGAFSNCVSLDKITILNDKIILGKDIFKCCENITLYGNKGSNIEVYAKDYNIKFLAIVSSKDDIKNDEDFVLNNDFNFTNDNSLDLVDDDYYKNFIDNQICFLDENATIIPEKFYMSNEYIKSIHIPSSIKIIKQDAFRYCFNLKVVELPNGIEKVEAFAFANIDTLYIYIPNTIMSLDDSVFTNTNVKIYSNSDYVKNYASRNNLEYVQVESIQDFRNLADSFFTVLTYEELAMIENFRNLSLENKQKLINYILTL